MGDPTRCCPDCGADISHRHFNAKRCEACAPLASARAWAGDKPRSRPCAVDDAECTPGRLKLGHCPLHYSRLKSRGVTTPPEQVDHFARYEVASNGCWLWTGPVHWNGYGHGAESMGDRLPHRAFYMLHVGSIPDGADVDHTCHNADKSCAGGVTCLHRRCVNPAHLEATTHQVNMSRGRSATGCRCTRHDLTLPGALRPDGGCTECWRENYRAAGKRYRERKARKAS